MINQAHWEPKKKLRDKNVGPLPPTKNLESSSYIFNQLKIFKCKMTFCCFSCFGTGRPPLGGLGLEESSLVQYIHFWRIKFRLYSLVALPLPRICECMVKNYLISKTIVGIASLSISGTFKWEAVSRIIWFLQVVMGHDEAYYLHPTPL